jgi:hypothetical protein
MPHLFHIFAAATLGALLASSATPAFAKTAEQCKADYAANKASIAAGGKSEDAYLAACRAAPDATATAPGAPAPIITVAPVITKTKADCAAEYRANMAAIKASGQSKAAFDADCRAGTEKIPKAPTSAAAAPSKGAPSSEAAPALRKGD